MSKTHRSETCMSKPTDLKHACQKPTNLKHACQNPPIWLYCFTQRCFFLFEKTIITGFSPQIVNRTLEKLGIWKINLPIKCPFSMHFNKIFNSIHQGDFDNLVFLDGANSPEFSFHVYTHIQIITEAVDT